MRWCSGSRHQCTQCGNDGGDGRQCAARDFREDDCVRFHPIINSGGDLVNVIPDYVKMESYTRAANVEALARYNRDINRALNAGAMALNAKCDITDLPLPPA